MLSALVDRLLAAPSETAPSATTRAMIVTGGMPTETAAMPRPASALQALNVVRDFSVVLTHSLEAGGLLRGFLLLLRGILGVNRAAIFLRESGARLEGAADVASRSPQSAVSTSRMRSACAVGLTSDLINNVDLSYERGIGGYLAVNARILRRDESIARENVEIQKEFQVLGAQVAVPIMDRETMIGVALFDGRVTGEPLPNLELESVFHLLEGLAMAVRNIWLHDQVATHSELLAAVLRELNNACVVVNQNLEIVHANKSARHHFSHAGRRTGEMEFSDLPTALGSKIYQVLKTGTAIAPFRFEPPESPSTAYQVTIVPLHGRNAVAAGVQPGGPESVLLVVEDRTQIEQLQQLEIETANLRLVRTMADRLAHEIGNALVPLSTHQQLLSEKYRDPDFRASLEHALEEGVKRVSRLTSQMRYLARDAVLSKEPLTVKALIEDAYKEAQKHHHTQKPAKLSYHNGTPDVTVAGDRAALKHAIAEVLLNALQANDSNGKIDVSAETITDPSGSRWVQIAIEDGGQGFSVEAARRVPEPFYTTRNVGLGLGLTVSRKIIEVHHGRLQIEPAKAGQHGVVRISLPAEK